MRTRILIPTALLSAAVLSCARAQGIATDRLIDSITVTAERRGAAIEVPAPAASRTALDLRVQNLVNPEDALQYVPNLTIRKRYIGDRNALIGGRSFSTLQAPRALVLMDGYLLSNFLARFDAPRWNMVAPEEIERVDVLYGPFCAIYPGNSLGTTVAIRTRRPRSRQLGVRTTAFGERFTQYGAQEDYTGYQVSGFFGDRLASGAWYTFAANRQDSTSHPMQYYTVTADAAGRFPAVTSQDPPRPVTGVVFDVDPFGRARAVFGASAGAIDHTVQNQWKLRGGRPLGGLLEIEGFVAQWSNDTRNENRTFMRDAAGNPLWQGTVVARGIAFDVPASAFAPSLRDERHVQWGATLRTLRDAGWNGSLVYSEYEIQDDHLLQAEPDPLNVLGNQGTNTRRDGTGWRTLEAQAVYAPAEGSFASDHTLALGYHRNDYRLSNPVYHSNVDWRELAGVLDQDVQGETSLQAWYAQDQWAFARRWSLTLGVRYEDWRARDGMQFVPAIDPQPQAYPGRSEQRWSPKASLSFNASDAWSLRLSAGRGVRFPTVAELFLGTVTRTQIVRNDPDLQPEVSDAVDLSAEYRRAAGRLRVSLFQDDIRDTIWNQIDISMFPGNTVQTVQNVDRVRTRGIETVFALERFAVDSLAIEGSVAYTRSSILRNDRHPDYIGNSWPRVPDWRATLQAVWRPSPSWTASVGVRHSGRMYSRLENDDINPDTYGGVSRLTMLDARVLYAAGNGTELALGLDNLTDERAYQSHPYPARTAFLEVRWSLEGSR